MWYSWSYCHFQCNMFPIQIVFCWRCRFWRYFSSFWIINTMLVTYSIESTWTCFIRLGKVKIFLFPYRFLIYKKKNNVYKKESTNFFLIMPLGEITRQKNLNNQMVPRMRSKGLSNMFARSCARPSLPYKNQIGVASICRNWGPWAWNAHAC